MTRHRTMRRWPVVVSFVLFIAICASTTAWVLRWLQPAPRPMAIVAAADTPAAADLSSASTLFGAASASAPVSADYALRGVIAALKPGEGIAFISADGKHTEAVREGNEVIPGVRVKEVHSQFVLLSEGGRERRVDLPERKGDTTADKRAAAAPEQRAAGAPEQRASGSERMAPPPKKAGPVETRIERTRRRAASE